MEPRLAHGTSLLRACQWLLTAQDKVQILAGAGASPSACSPPGLVLPHPGSEPSQLLPCPQDAHFCQVSGRRKPLVKDWVQGQLLRGEPSMLLTSLGSSSSGAPIRPHFPAPLTREESGQWKGDRRDTCHFYLAHKSPPCNPLLSFPSSATSN